MLKDYTVSISVEIAITAYSMFQAQERTTILESAVVEGLNRLERKPWLRNIEAPESETKESS